MNFNTGAPDHQLDIEGQGDKVMCDDTVLRIQNGDREAFEMLFRNYYGQLCRFAQNYVFDMSAAEDLVQNFFVRLWEIRAQWEPKGTVESYLFLAVRNRAFDYLKQNRTRMYNHEQLSQENENLDHSTENQFTADEFEAAYKQAVEALPEKCRVIFKMHRQEGMKYEEIANILEVSPKTVEAQIARGLQILRTKLRPWLRDYRPKES